jgi:hypothetical protein
MIQKPDHSVTLYDFAIDLQKRGYDLAVLDEWIADYPSLADEFIDFFVDEVRAEEMHADGNLSVPTPSLDTIKATGLSELRLRMVQRTSGAAKRA